MSLCCCLPRQWQDLGVLRLRRSAHRVGPPWLPGDPISGDYPRVERRQPYVHEPHRGQSLHPPPVSQGLGGGGAVAVAESCGSGRLDRLGSGRTRAGTSMWSPVDQRLPLRTTWWYSVSRSIGTRPASVIRRRISATVASCGVSAPAS